MLTEENVQQFTRDGFLVVENFLSPESCDELKQECDKIIESNNFVQEISKMSVFDASADAKEEAAREADIYFLTSTDKIRPFLESRAKEVLDKDGKSNKIFNKIGHALHALNPVFKKHTFNEQTRQAFKALGFVEPIVCQSMYIFKQPFIGGEVKPHQDGTYIHNEPLKVVGCWIALEDATLENGCLEFLPGSHNEPLAARFKRNPNKEEFEKGKFLVHTNDYPKYDQSRFVSVPVKAGDAVFIHGLVVHQSRPNLSANSRHIYTYHVYEGHESVWSSDNWMEYSPVSFLKLNEQ